MKKLLAQIILIFLLAFSATLLLEINLISKNWLRYGLVIIITFFILITGVFHVIDEVKKLNKK